MSRNANGEGSIYARQDGRYAGAAYVITRDGARRRRTVYGKTRREVAAKLRTLQEQSAQGIPAYDRGMPLRDYLAHWLDAVAAEKVSAKTLVNYRLFVNRHIVPVIGDKRIGTLSSDDVRALIAAKRKEGFAPRTVRQMHATLRVALQHAVRERLVPANVAGSMSVRIERESSINPFDSDEARSFLQAVRGDPWEALWIVAITMGLRKGELLGLQWHDVDLAGGSLMIRRSLQRIGTELVTAPPKTRSSIRALQIPSMAAKALVAHRELEEEKARAFGHRWARSRPVFTSAKGALIEPRDVNHALDRVLTTADLRRIRVHDLRHTCATLLLSQGVPQRVIMDQLGHSSITVTMNIYAHVMPAMHTDSAARMDALLQREEGDE